MNSHWSWQSWIVDFWAIALPNLSESIPSFQFLRLWSQHWHYGLLECAIEPTLDKPA
ncbi:MAG: hypothetical protein MUF49_31055 [Oculatellaceae cyanobacterium Prado106]|nr:hypothetical protein [Oculatellaceae cyanobacterium Prado106]